MTAFRVSRLGAAGLSAAAALALAGCNSMTYGTGTPPGIQTLKDVTGIVDINNQDKPKISYVPRAKIVAPPAQAAATLPPPVADGGNGAGAPLPANWPKDPDQEYAKFKADVAAREAAGKPLPKITVVPGKPPPGTVVENPTGRPLTKEEQDKVRKAMADAKSLVAVDENGNPVRRYLTDPPVDYRLPDPESTVDVNALPDKKKTKKTGWWPFGGKS